MPKLSIIVPVYNVENYLHKCVDSILSQTFNDYEVILIDDGSPDSCGEIIDEYVHENTNVIAIHQANRGVSAARNAGLKIARGEYIGFVDGDDWIEPHMYSSLIQIMEVENCDIASCSWTYETEGIIDIYFSHLSSSVMSQIDFMKHLFDMPITISGSVCCKVFKKSIVQIIFSEQYKICEDNLFMAQCIVNCNKAVYVNTPLYHIVNRPDSTIRNKADAIVPGLVARKKIIGIADKVDKNCKMLAEAVFLDQSIYFYNMKNILRQQYYKLVLDEYVDYFKNNYKSIVFNNASITWKQKLLYIQKYFAMTIERKNV